ncbi:mitochondrial choline dehydrogenase [Andalucia godoyi]|uniref:Mitochondrial choline dehydrogenase n=1 Tax=Andalucia godoyi TaxID=505711 RepID=A0A8K0AH17_ANDGO|nr:mitochondrial choline dehydrogenase [Andalucia godoyi]|eukprot:ANDGO_04259.mRNA.1 mitochondrial choline dehydrogenase
MKNVLTGFHHGRCGVFAGVRQVFQRTVANVYDYVIVGGGSAGCVLANRLSADPKNRVLLLEAGTSDDYFWIKIPVGYLFTIGNPRTDWCMKTVPDPGLNGRSLYPYARGFVLGGCSSINAMIAMRGQRWDYNFWASSTRSNDWSWDALLPLFRRIEDYVPFSEAENDAVVHGKGGPFRIENPRVQWDILDRWREAAAECGIPSVREFNRGDNFGCAYFHVNQKNGKRWSMADAFLHPVRTRKNLEVQTSTACQRVVFAKNKATNGRLRAVGVRVAKGHTSSFSTISVRKEIILAAGAIHTPTVLQHSGVGHPEDLEKIGQEVTRPLIGVGRNLQDHLQIRTCYKVRGVPTLNTLYHNYLTRARMGLEYLLQRKGPLTMPPSTLGAFAKSDPSQEYCNIEWHVQPLSLPKFSDPLDTFDAITPSVCNLRPTSRGSVLANPAMDPYAHPSITTNYLSTEEDRTVAVDALQFTRRIMKSAALAKYKPEEFRPGPEFSTPEQLLDAARSLGTTIFHPVGTCKMGHDSDPEAVVNSRLQVFGIDGLRVADASIMPRITSGNTNYPTVIIAERAAEYILQEQRHGE